jgi:hypothetical protein
MGITEGKKALDTVGPSRRTEMAISCQLGDFDLKNNVEGEVRGAGSP